VVLNNAALTVEQVIAALNGLMSQVAQAEATQTLANTQTATADATAQDVALMMSALRSVIQGHFGKANVEVLDFGMSPVKRGERTVASKAVAIARSLATRAERHTWASARAPRSAARTRRRRTELVRRRVRRRPRGDRNEIGSGRVGTRSPVPDRIPRRL
jgi:hypothetical protein